MDQAGTNQRPSAGPLRGIFFLGPAWAEKRKRRVAQEVFDGRKLYARCLKQVWLGQGLEESSSDLIASSCGSWLTSSKQPCSFQSAHCWREGNPASCWAAGPLLQAAKAPGKDQTAVNQGVNVPGLQYLSLFKGEMNIKRVITTETSLAMLLLPTPSSPPKNPKTKDWARGSESTGSEERFLRFASTRTTLLSCLDFFLSQC